MKKILGVILVVLTLSSCEQIINYGTDAATGSRYSDMDIYYGPFLGVETEADIPYWMDMHVHYKTNKDTVQSPEEFVSSGYGDCDEFALLYLDIMYVVFRKKGEICIVKSGRTVEAGGRDYNHTVVRYGSTIIEPMTGKVAHYEVGYSYAFDDIFNK